VPNPLFDVAGLACGHLQIPFSVFFISTFIGKAINKISIQTFFIIFAFSKRSAQRYVAALN
jgi:membrane protein YqaA with SNARE-associated domain